MTNTNGLTTLDKTGNKDLDAVLMYIEDAVSYINYVAKGNSLEQAGMTEAEALAEAKAMLGVAVGAIKI